MKNKIAIVGLSGRFPGAKGIASFWDNLCKKKESISTLTENELLDSGILEKQFQSSSYIRSRGLLENVEEFDADFFSIPSMEAQVMDPQHRHFLECCWEALENAGYNPERFDGKIGVFGGASRSTYFLNHLYPNSNIYSSAGEFLCRTGNENDCFATRVSYKLNLKGPSLSVQTACSSALVAVCLACNHLLSYQCDIAIAGGASIFSPQKSGYAYQEGMIFSPDGHCRPFDVRAQGTVPGNGVGVVILKRLEEAIAARDHIYAIIQGYAVNNDGHEKIGFSAPSVQGQMEAIVSAINMAGIDSKTIRYVEAHGTGTSIGDPIEMAALSKAFTASTKDKITKCCIGSLKGNIGHLMEAAGIAGLIKAILALKHQKIPPTLHFTKFNSSADFTKDSFYVNSELEEWEENPWPRRAGVSAFGFGGTNAHVTLEEYCKPKLSNPPLTSKAQVLPISAKTPQALKILSLQLADFLQHNPTLSLADVAYTLQIGRKEWKCRKAIVCSDIQQAIRLLLNTGSSSPMSDNQENSKLNHIAESWMSGESVDWDDLHAETQPSRIPLPTYPFERKRCWIDPPMAETGKYKQHETITPLKTLTEDVEEKLILIWKNLLGCEQLDRRDNFFELGGESLLALQILTQIEKTMGVSLSLQSFYQAPTVMQLAHLISLKSPANFSNVIQLKKGDSSPPLFMIHPIQGTISCYEQLAKRMNLRGAIFGIQSDESTENSTIEEMAEFYVKEIKKIQESGPYFLFGASFGGLLAHEISYQLKKEGHSIALLAMLDVLNPSYETIKKDTLRDMQMYLLELLEGKKIPINVLNTISDKELSDRISSSMGLNLLSKEQKDKAMNRINNHLQAIQKYKPKPFDGEIIFFEMNQRALESQHISFWKSWTDFAKEVKVTTLEGNHLNMLQNPVDLAKHLETHFINI